MEINNDTIHHLSRLARLEFTGEELESIRKDFEKILAFVDKLKELDVEGVEPLIYLNEKKLFWREDHPGEEVNKSLALKNAPDKDSDYFLVPKVLEK